MSIVFHHVSKRLKTPQRLLARQKSSAAPFRVKTAEFLAAASAADQIPALNGRPEIIVTGRANCGKSTLLSAVLGQKDLFRTSKKAGCTRTLNFYRVGEHPGSVVLVDAPGYGARGRPEWGDLFNTYITTRKQLKRVYILFNGKHPLNPADLEMVANLSDTLYTQEGAQPYTLQAIITKADCIPSHLLSEVLPKIHQQIWEAAPLCLPPIVTSAMMTPKFGIEEVRSNIAEACGLAIPSDSASRGNLSWFVNSVNK
ncbi:P-loop containing nucleoside triphosphate hydrolase protein [Mycena metata]|uniref:P-loop containing nucleoside triphosphate hydrolase protein n=1 Tax=Mycena metata TaxID=1033252 RepID=A0AAD7NVR2_9AGAR|nr:P-loop containing nucleoside triphosphate hydrolase protein [Mycena metata]